jgi:hypothetical protein
MRRPALMDPMIDNRLCSHQHHSTDRTVPVGNKVAETWSSDRAVACGLSKQRKMLVVRSLGVLYSAPRNRERRSVSWYECAGFRERTRIAFSDLL